MTWILSPIFAKRFRLRRKPSLQHITPSPYLYSERGEGHGYAQSRVLREQWMDVYDNYEEGFKVGYPYVKLLGARYQMRGKCPTCSGAMLLREVKELEIKEPQRSQIPFCPHCRKEFTQSEFNWNDRADPAHYNPQFETVGVEVAWNDPIPSEAQFDVSRHSPGKNSSGVRQY